MRVQSGGIPLSVQDFAVIRSQLLAEWSEIVRRLRDGQEYGLDQPMNDAVSELSGYDQHPADLGSEMFEREKDLALREHDRIRLEKVEQALVRIADDSYGICTQCGKSIEILRLEAEPTATHCMDCAKELQGPLVMHDRPVEEEVLYPPFGRTNLDGTDQTGFDGEDSWQAVAAMNNTRDPESDSCDELYYEGGGYVEPIEQISNEDYKRQLP